MRKNAVNGRILITVAVLSGLLSTHAHAQSSSDITVLEGLAPVTALTNTSAGRAAFGPTFRSLEEFREARSHSRHSCRFPYSRSRRYAMLSLPAAISPSSRMDWVPRWGRHISCAFTISTRSKRQSSRKPLAS